MLSASSTPIVSAAARRLIAQFVVVAAFAVLFNASPASAMKQSTSENQMMQVEAALFAAVPDAKGPGAVVLIARGENVLSVTARGVADVTWSIPLTPSQTFAIASVTKTFTAAAVMKLTEEGRLSLDDNLSSSRRRDHRRSGE